MTVRRGSPRPRGGHGATPWRLRWALASAVAVALPGSIALATVQAANAQDGAPARTFAAAYQDPTLSVAARVTDLMAQMTVDEKIGQMVQGEQTKVKPGDVTTDLLGSVLSGGNSAPAGNTATAWADMYDSYQRGALATRLGIPMIYGIDAVHGNAKVHGATVFPHNIGLGATRNPALVEQIARATAEEVTGSGLDWTFAPCLCVARDDRWGRTYESFGETPELVSSMTTAVTGFQGANLDAPGSVLATAKHYIGDGGTTRGDDQGNTEITEAELRAVHLPPFKAAVERGVGSVMVSYSSFRGAKLHGHKYLITDVLKGELGFTGFVVSDWAAVDQLDGKEDFTEQEVAAGVNAGIDMMMVPADHKRFLEYLKKNVANGTIPMSRVDDAVQRILTKKFELGLFEKPFADRTYAATVGSSTHRQLARQAVAESQVLLKNSEGALPLAKSGGKIFVAGKNADDIGHQSGGWTINWQGKSGNITPGTTILQGIRNAVGSGTTVQYSKDGSGIDGSYRAAIAVVGETPYAEGDGDVEPGPRKRQSLALDAADVATLQRLKDSGVPVITVLVSGRPMEITDDQLRSFKALVAAWLPGTEGSGVADVLFGDVKPTGKLPMTWPTSTGQEPINDGDGKTGLFPYGHGLTYGGSSPAPSVSPSPVASSAPVPTASPSPSLSPSPSRSSAASPSPAATVHEPVQSPTPTPDAAPRCTVGYKVTSSWGTGFIGDVTVSAIGGNVSGWTLNFTLPGGQRIDNSWNAAVTQSGGLVTARNAAWNGQLGTTNWGFQASGNAGNGTPTGFTINGKACSPA